MSNNELFPRNSGYCCPHCCVKQGKPHAWDCPDVGSDKQPPPEPEPDTATA